MTTTHNNQGEQTAGTGRHNGRGKFPKRKPPETIKTWAFDSVGDRKYAVQIQKASNGNPCLKIVEGVPQDDGSFRKIHIKIWSEDFDAFFAHLDEVRAYIDANDIKTPPDHDWKPGKYRRKAKKG